THGSIEPKQKRPYQKEIINKSDPTHSGPHGVTSSGGGDNLARRRDRMEGRRRVEVKSEDLQVVIRAAPFRPFTLCLANGSQFTIEHPEWIAFRGGRTAIVLDQDERA